MKYYEHIFNMDLVFFYLLITMFFTCDSLDEIGECDFDDPQCESAIQSAQNMRQRCKVEFQRALQFNTPLNEICIEDFFQLKRRFTVVFNTDKEWEETCNPCASPSANPALCSREKGVPGTLAPCPAQHAPPDRVIIPDEVFDINKFLPKFRWHQDENVRPRFCCITTKRTIPLMIRCGTNCYTVYCPSSGGYQWYDEVECNVTMADVQSEKYGELVTRPSRNKCRKPCRTNYAKRTYLVTNLPPQGFFGHCSYIWLPVWFKKIKVRTHCTCPRI